MSNSLLTRRTDLGVRVAGLLFCWIGYAAVGRLVALHVVPAAAGVVACGLAGVGFLAASVGLSMVMLGGHVFDRIEVSMRWRPKPVVVEAAVRRDVVVEEEREVVLA